MSWLSKATGIHVSGATLAAGAASLVPGGGVLAGLARGAASLQRTPVIQGKGFGGSVSFNNPFTQGGGLIGFLTGSGGKKGRQQPVNGQCPRGYHLNKHKLSDGTAARSVCVANRHMNVSNGRATARAVRRIHGAEKQYRHVFTILHKKPAGKILPKHKAR